MTLALATFAVAATVLIIAAVVLTKAGDAIAERTGIGRVWIGAVLVAGATSLPELATDVSAVRIGAADLAAGDLFGSSMANMLILASIDLLAPRRRVLRTVSLDNALAAALAVVLNAIAAVLILTRSPLVVFGVAPGSLLLLAVYVAGTRAVYRQGARVVPPPAPDATVAPPAATLSLKAAIVRFVLAAVVIFVAAPFVASSAKQIADVSGLGSTFVGTLLVALVTSLPEVVSCIVAIRMGVLDLAVGNLFGSNAFNMIVFFAMDVASPGPIFAMLDPAHGVAALSAIVLMGLGLAAIVYRAERRYALIEPSSLIMLVVYLASVALLYAHVT